ncbi:MAG: SAM-dependent chlorinase/fluorinase [Candidatus Omnitrophota bacterium]
MSTIALMTDFGLKDNFVGVMKGAILSINPDVRLVDISHDVNPQDIFEAAFLLKGSFKYFPEGTIFLVVVDPGVGSERRPVIVQTEHYCFVGPDNGVLSLAVREDGIKEIKVAENKAYFRKPVSDTFHGRDIFAPVAAHLSGGKKLDSFGESNDYIEQLNIHEPEEDKNVLKGEVIYIDRFGNLVSNISKLSMRRFAKGRPYKVKIEDKTIKTISRSYEDTEQRKPLAIFGSFGFLEISVSNDNAQKFFNGKKGTPVTVHK